MSMDAVLTLSLQVAKMDAHDAPSRPSKFPKFKRYPPKPSEATAPKSTPDIRLLPAEAPQMYV